MTAPRRWSASLLLVLASAMGVVAPSAVVDARASTPASATRHSAAGQVSDYIDHRWPHGASGTILVARGNRLVACRGLGWADRARRIPATCDTGYDIMSMTKQFTAAAVLKLETMGRLSTSDRLGRWFTDVPPDKQAITVAELLDQTSGFVEALGDDYQHVSRARLVRRAMRSSLLSAPGARFHYSNVNYSLLAAIVEKASGTSYERFLRRHLFLPSGMRHTGYVLPRWRPRQVVVEYDRHGRPQGHPFDHPWGVDGPYWNLRGNGGLISTARDMFRWHRALLGTSVLSTAAKQELFTPRIQEEPGSPYRYAYGWDILPTRLGRLATHNGGDGWSFGAFGRLLSHGTAAFWVSNQAYRTGRWNLEDLDPSFTIGLLRRAR